jgi:hypothetical protein
MSLRQLALGLLRQRGYVMPYDSDADVVKIVIDEEGCIPLIVGQSMAEMVLVTTQFWNTTTRGFSAVGEPRVAVCLLPGTEVAFEREVERQLTGFQLIFRRAAAP